MDYTDYLNSVGYTDKDLAPRQKVTAEMILQAKFLLLADERYSHEQHLELDRLNQTDRFEQSDLDYSGYPY